MFDILMADLLVREGSSLMRTKIDARLYDGEYGKYSDEYSRMMHRKMMKLKEKYKLPHQRKISMVEYVEILEKEAKWQSQKD